MNRLRFGAALHFIIAIGHVACLFALDEAFEAYGIREIMHQMEALTASMISDGCNLSHLSFLPLLHGATGREL